MQNCTKFKMGPHHTGNTPKINNLDTCFVPLYEVYLLKITLHHALWPFYMLKFKRCSLMNSRNKMVLLEYTCNITFSSKIVDMLLLIMIMIK